MLMHEVHCEDGGFSYTRGRGNEIGKACEVEKGGSLGICDGERRWDRFVR